MTEKHLLVEDQPAEQDLEFLEDQINRYNMAQVAAFDARRLAIFVRDEQQIIIAGISGYTWAGMCEIQFLWVAAELRGQGHGGRLLEAAEQEARDRGCQIVILNSYSFQAPGFYGQRGYSLVGQIDNCPPHHSNSYFKKMLSAAE
ncbi:MAG: GNAT family N-acetyltransferase [Chloroflexi bacterium]|nr:GNAT family N-acetyltransferase [Chloroflexota bacterium]